MELIKTHKNLAPWMIVKQNMIKTLGCYQDDMIQLLTRQSCNSSVEYWLLFENAGPTRKWNVKLTCVTPITISEIDCNPIRRVWITRTIYVLMLKIIWYLWITKNNIRSPLELLSSVVQLTVLRFHLRWIEQASLIFLHLCWCQFEKQLLSIKYFLETIAIL